MFCSSCGKAVAPGTNFCPHCGACQEVDLQLPTTLEAARPAPVPAASAPIAVPAVPAAAPMATAAPAVAPAQLRVGKGAVWGGVAALVLAVVGGVGYWGWTNKVAGEEATRQLAADEVARKQAADDVAQRLAVEEQRRVAAEQAATIAEVAAAQALLDRHIAAEEAQAQLTAKAPGVIRQ